MGSNDLIKIIDERELNMNERFTNSLFMQLKHDRKLLLKIQRYRGALRSQHVLNEQRIRQCARESLPSVIQLFKDKGLPEQKIFATIKCYHEKGDEEKIFSLIFFYCNYFDEDLPDLLLPLAVNQTALRMYFSEWMEEIKQCSLA